MYELGHLGLYKNIPKKRMFNSTPDYDRDTYDVLQYKSHLRNEFLIPLKANGDGSGVATIRLQSLETQTVKITGNGKFYTDSSGTTEAGIESTIGTTLGSLYVKVPAGESCYLVCGKADKLSGLGNETTSVIADGANIPYINYCAVNYPLINLSVIRLTGVLNSSIIGSIDNTPNLTYIHFYLNQLSKITGSIDNTPKLNTINFQNNPLSEITGSTDNTPNLSIISFNSNPLSEITGDIGKSTKSAFYNFGLVNIKSQLTYVTPRNTIDKWPSGQLRLIYLSMTSMTSAMCDSLLIDIDASGVMPVNEGRIDLSGLCGAVSSASAPARTSLVNKGFTVVVNTQGG
jgi:hypothetical protein